MTAQLLLLAERYQQQAWTRTAVLCYNVYLNKELQGPELSFNQLLLVNPGTHLLA